MKLKRLLKNISVKAVKGSKETEITGICANSKLVAPGNLFIAKKGRVDDGNRYIPQAIAAGASAILTDIYDPSLKNIAQIIHPDAASIEGIIASTYYNTPSHELFMVGVTGTNGKTTTSFLVKYFLDSLEQPCGLIGTIEYIIGEYHYQATHTTPDVVTNHKLLREMILHGCKSAVMEVTSHALDQGRTACIDYDVAIFTNLSLDHLDYHQTMDAYCTAKNKLFISLGQDKKNNAKKFPKYAVVNADSPWHLKILNNCKASILTYGIENTADLRASNIVLSGSNTRFDLTYQGKTISCVWPLIGRFNVYNALAAVAVCLCKGESLDKIKELIRHCPSVVGRLQPVPNGLGLKIFVDFAHSDEALANVLETLHELKRGKIITVFGCGGDRDRSKRSKMAQVAEEFSDLCIVTNDNPRSEDPVAIGHEIIKGFQRKDSYMMELDRRCAIQRAIDLATVNDVILIAGRGHERSQIFAHKIIEFDDYKVAYELCKNKRQLQD